MVSGTATGISSSAVLRRTVPVPRPRGVRAGRDCRPRGLRCPETCWSLPTPGDPRSPGRASPKHHQKLPSRTLGLASRYPMPASRKLVRKGGRKRTPTRGGWGVQTSASAWGMVPAKWEPYIASSLPDKGLWKPEAGSLEFNHESGNARAQKPRGVGELQARSACVGGLGAPKSGTPWTSISFESMDVSLPWYEVRVR